MDNLIGKEIEFVLEGKTVKATINEVVEREEKKFYDSSIRGGFNKAMKVAAFDVYFTSEEIAEKAIEEHK